MAWKIAETLIYVSDLDASVEHYVERFGFELVARYPFGFALVKSPDGHRLGLMPMTAWDKSWKPGEPVLPPCTSLETDDLQAETARLREAGCDVDEIKNPDGDMPTVVFRDPDGTPFFLWQDVAGVNTD